MAISLGNLKRSSDRKAPRILNYGVAGIGKTSLGMAMPRPVFLQTEESEVDVPTWGLLRDFPSVMQALAALYTEDHDFQTVVLDSLDWLEPMVWAEVSQRNSWKSIEDAGYGKGYLAALDVWREILDGFNGLRDDKGMGVLFIAHAEIKRFDSPETEPYDRYQPKLHTRASALVQEHVDAVLFANYRVSVLKADVGFKKTVARGASGGDRLLHANERPAFLAKNRWNMPDSIPLDWNTLASFIPFYTNEPQAAPAAAAAE